MAWVRTAMRWLRTRVISPKRVRIHLARSGTSADVKKAVSVVLAGWRRGCGFSESSESDVPHVLVAIVACGGRRNPRRERFAVRFQPGSLPVR